MSHKTISIQEQTHQVLDHLKSTGQSFDGEIKELIEKAENKTFEELLEEAETNEQ